ncbi:hypothetical protein BDR26DRAFT_892850 [Obelidium mucronatum]|nr:hypothetical protein BDR26DRAFT_892850 [Obelidium mucronatum]
MAPKFLRNRTVLTDIDTTVYHSSPVSREKQLRTHSKLRNTGFWKHFSKNFGIFGLGGEARFDSDACSESDFELSDDESILSSPATLHESFQIDPFESLKEEESPAKQQLKFWSSRSFHVVAPSLPTQEKSEQVSQLSRLLKASATNDESAKSSLSVQSESITQTTPTARSSCKPLPREILSCIFYFLAVADYGGNDELSDSSDTEAEASLKQQLHPLITCSTVSKQWSEEAVRWIWRDAEVLCHGFTYDRVFDILVKDPYFNNNPPSTSRNNQLFETEDSSDSECSSSSLQTLYNTHHSSPSTSGVIRSHDTLKVFATHPYSSFMRALSLEIAFPSLDDEIRCSRLCTRLNSLTRALQEEKFKGLRKCRVSLSWFPCAQSVAFDDDTGDEESVNDLDDGDAGMMESNSMELGFGFPDASAVGDGVSSIRVPGKRSCWKKFSAEDKRLFELKNCVDVLLVELKKRVKVVETFVNI